MVGLLGAAHAGARWGLRKRGPGHLFHRDGRPRPLDRGRDGLRQLANGFMYALNAATGAVEWKSQVDTPSSTVDDYFGVVVADGGQRQGLRRARLMVRPALCLRRGHRLQSVYGSRDRDAGTRCPPGASGRACGAPLWCSPTATSSPPPETPLARTRTNRPTTSRSSASAAPTWLWKTPGRSPPRSGSTTVTSGRRPPSSRGPSAGCRPRSWARATKTATTTP